MTKLSVIWSLIAAVVVGGAAVTTGYIYMDRQEKSAEAPASSPEETTEVASSTGTAEPGASQPADADAGAQQEAGPDLKAATESLTFDAVGVEPTGETVVAGRSDAGAIVALTANGEVVGKAIANEKGEWTIILDNPLKPGDYDVGLQVTDDAGTTTHESSQRLTVSVPEDGKSQPLVVLNKPEGPSDVLQKPDAVQTAGQEEPAGETVVASAAEEEPAGETVVASAAEEEPVETVVETKPEPETTAPGTPSATEPDTAATEPEAPAATGGAEAEKPAMAETPEPAAPAQETEVASAEPETPAVAEAPADTAVGAPAADAPAPAAEGPAAAQTETAPAAEVAAVATGHGATEQTEAAPAAQAVSAPAADPVTESAFKATVEAVESQGSKLYVAGTGEPDYKVRVYVAGEFVGETRVGPNGRWLVEGSRALQPGTVEVRADLIGDDKGTVVARAAVNFEKAAEQIVLTRVIASGETATDAGGAGATVTKPLPNVIIHKGDNLWSISRRLYGKGTRYTTIYQANKGQIRNPDLIYPGQVFLTPESDVNWTPESN